MTKQQAQDEAIALATSALKLMDERTIAPTPNNFAVWYNYFSGDRPDLNRALSILLESETDFTPERNAQIFEKYCAAPYEAVPMHLIAERMEAELATVLGVLDQAERHALAYGRTLETVQGALAKPTPSQAMIEVLSRLLDQTRAMRQQSRDAERQLEDSAMEVNRLRDQLEDARREAMTDSLTAIANRKMFDFVLRQSAMDAMESGEPLSLLMLDIDHFKQFNDTHGHHIGDQVLRLLAAVLKQSVKGQDTPARYGGEEFAVVLPQTTLENAVKVAEAVRVRVARRSVVNRATSRRLGSFTVSVGAAEFRPGEPLRVLVERADRALYVAKHSGRNRVESELVAPCVEEHAVSALSCCGN
ncbi:MAG: diguanylate cyclase [Rhodospirillales bacterium]|nr:diguanylate cyclase [Rhodospirillales bacterium]